MGKQDSYKEQLKKFQNICDIAVKKYPIFTGAKVKLLNYSENATYLVEQPTAEKYILRVCRPGYHTKKQIEYEMKFIDSISKSSDVVVSPAIVGGNGEIVQEVELDGTTYYCNAFEYLEGDAPNEDNEAELVQQFESLGEVTAKLHNHSYQNWQTFQQFDRLAWDFDAILGPTPKWGRWQDGLGMTAERKKLFEAVSKKIDDRLKKFGKSPERYGLIHGDLRSANLLVDNNQIKVIDFDDCGFGWYLHDLGTALSFIEHKPYVPDLIEAWVKGYRKVRNLSEEEEREIPTFVLFRRLHLVAWVGSRDNEYTRMLGASFAEDTDEIARKYLNDTFM